MALDCGGEAREAVAALQGGNEPPLSVLVRHFLQQAGHLREIWVVEAELPERIT